MHAFITGLSVEHNNKRVQLNVQVLNDVFFGARMQQHHQVLPGKMHSGAAPAACIQSIAGEGGDEAPAGFI